MAVVLLTLAGAVLRRGAALRLGRPLTLRDGDWPAGHGCAAAAHPADVGMNAAIASAVWHATGRRLRRLPIGIEDLL